MDTAALSALLRTRATAQPTRIVGVTGHLLLDADERARAESGIRAYCRHALEHRPGTLRLLTGLAPGADLVATAILLEEADRRGVRVELIALLPGTPAQLIEDWLARAHDSATAPSAAARASVEKSIHALLARAHRVIDLCAVEPPLRDRRLAYRRLAALLACIPDVLIAVFREGHDGLDGGTGETVAWRRATQRIPEIYRFPADEKRGDELVVIDPRLRREATATAEAREDGALVRAHLRAGNALSAYDLARGALERHDTPELRYLLLLSLAAAGSTHAALEQYETLAPAEAERDEDWLALHGRLCKDLAFAGIDPRENLRRAADEYGAAHTRTGGSFSAVNAATLRLLAGDSAGATALAQAALADDMPREGESGDYYAAATRAEAQLVLENADACRSALQRANPLLRDDLITRSRTRRQLARIAAHHGIDTSIVDVLEMPCVYLLEISNDSPRGVISKLSPERLPGSPVYAVFDAAPAAVRAVESCLQAGARMNFVLPEPRAGLLARCADLHGAAQAAGARACIEAAERSSTLRGFLPGEEPWNRSEAACMAQGLAAVAAANLGVPLRRLHRDGESGDWSIGDVAQPAPIAAARGRRMVGLIFTDIVGFRSYRDEDVHLFWSEVMRAFAADIAALGEDALLASTWGDALHVVTTGARPAAALCLRLLDTVARLRSGGRGAIAQLGLRVGAHYAPAYAGFDPVERRTTYYGTQLSFAASVEPITPPGMAYVTEALAAQLTLEAPGRFQLEYAGELALAKRYGSFRLHSLRAAQE